MNVATLAGVLRERARPRTHDGWTRDEILAYQARRLADVRAFATAHSPFYRDVHRGLEGASPSSLPVVTKATLMERFDDPVTDRDVRLADVVLMGFGDLTDAGIVRRLGACGSFGS